MCAVLTQQYIISEREATEEELEAVCKDAKIEATEEEIHDELLKSGFHSFGNEW